MNEVMEAIFSRRSVRRYRDQPVPPELVEQLLEAAVWAPSAHNRQPWRMAVITTAQTRHDLAQAMGQRLRADLAADGVAAEAIERDATRSYSRLTGAPLLVVMCLTMADMDTYPDAQRQRNEWTMAAQSVAMAGQNLLLAAHSLGLAACWVCAPLFCPDVVRAVLELPQDWQPLGLITAGYPAETKQKERRPLAGSVLFR